MSSTGGSVEANSVVSRVGFFIINNIVLTTANNNNISVILTIYGWQDSSLAECFPKDKEVCSLSLCHCILLWR